jgi:hypothetical protein
MPVNAVKVNLQRAIALLSGQPFPRELTRDYRDQARHDRAKPAA